MDDGELLARYVDEGSQEAFAQLVSRHLNLVYAAALRQVDSSDLAAEVAQIVFTNLARKARSMPRRTVLAGWLHRDTRYTVLDLLRSEQRRRLREQEALALNTLGPDPTPDWANLRPLLDEELDRLSPADRDALLLRFFEKRSLKEVGESLGFGEDAARKRVARGLEKLRTSLARRGVTTTGAALSVGITACGSQVAPAGLAAAILPGALAAGTQAAAGGWVISKLIKGFFMTKLQMTAFTLVLAAGVTSTLLEHQHVSALKAQNLALQAQLTELTQQDQENARRSNALAQAQPPALTKDQMTELLRLRSQVGQLRSDLKAVQAGAKAAAARAATSTPAGVQDQPPAEEETAPRQFTAEFTTHIPTGQAMITGGWTTSPGMRSFIMVTPTAVNSTGANANGPAQTLLNSVIFEVPEKQLAHLGLDQLTSATSQSSVQGLVGLDNAKSLFEALSNTEGVSVLSRPRVQTADGIAASIFIGSNTAESGNGQPVGHSIDFTPHLAADGSGMDLGVKAALSMPAAKSGGK